MSNHPDLERALALVDEIDPEFMGLKVRSLRDIVKDLRKALREHAAPGPVDGLLPCPFCSVLPEIGTIYQDGGFKRGIEGDVVNHEDDDCPACGLHTLSAWNLLAARPADEWPPKDGLTGPGGLKPVLYSRPAEDGLSRPLTDTEKMLVALARKDERAKISKDIFIAGAVAGGTMARTHESGEEWRAWLKDEVARRYPDPQKPKEETR